MDSIKDNVYAGNPKCTEDLKTVIQTDIESTETSILQRMMQYFAIRLHHIIDIKDALNMHSTNSRVLYFVFEFK